MEAIATRRLQAHETRKVVPPAIEGSLAGRVENFVVSGACLAVDAVFVASVVADRGEPSVQATAARHDAARTPLSINRPVSRTNAECPTLSGVSNDPMGEEAGQSRSRTTTRVPSPCLQFYGT